MIIYLETHLSICFLYLILNVLVDNIAVISIPRIVDCIFGVSRTFSMHRLYLIELVPLTRNRLIILLLLRRWETIL